VSLRSTDGSVNVAALAAKQGGGGHVRAAGFSSDNEPQSVLQWIEQQVEAHL
jgi:phosphoesterase RecJ-like protein